MYTACTNCSDKTLATIEEHIMKQGTKHLRGVRVTMVNKNKCYILRHEAK